MTQSILGRKGCERFAISQRHESGRVFHLSKHRRIILFQPFEERIVFGLWNTKDLECIRFAGALVVRNEHTLQ